MDLDKVKAVLEWKPPTNVKEVQSFLGFCNYYRRYIKNYSGVAKSITDLTHKDRVFEWTAEAQKDMDALKKRFSEEPILVHNDPERLKRVETDSSDFAVGAVYSQLGEDGRWRPVAFFSRKLTPAELNYEIYDKELLAIVIALRE